MGDLFLVNLGGDDDNERSRREAERLRLRDRYVLHIVHVLQIDQHTAKQVTAALFDHLDSEGRRCVCGCHPRLSPLHDGGFDCPCKWDETRRAEERQRLVTLQDTRAAAELREQHAAEEEAVAAWLDGQPGVEANRTTSYAPEQWEGTVDEHSFYFRERHGFWQIELDLEATGRFADRLVDVLPNGEIMTELFPVREGDEIAQGIDSELGDTPISHIAFIVRTIRDHLWRLECDHSGALFFCPKCGRRMEGPA